MLSPFLPPRSPAGLAPYGAALGAILCWATLAAALNASLEALRPAQILAWGFGVAALVLSVWDAAHGRPLWRTWPGWRVALLGVYGIFGYHALLVLAFTLAPPALANMLNYTWPLWIILLSAWVPGHASLRSGQGARVLAGAALGLGGVALVIGNACTSRVSASGVSSGTELTPSVATGLALALVAGFCWGSFTVGLRLAGAQAPNSPERPPAMAWFCWLAAACTGVWLAVQIAVQGTPLLPATGGWMLLYIGVVPLGLAFQLWEYAAGRCNLQVLGLFSYLTPPLSTALLAVQAGTAVPGRAWGGLALILAGSALGGAWAGSPRPGAR